MSEQYGHLSSEYYCTPLAQYFIEAKSCISEKNHLRASQYCALKDGKYCQELLHYSNRYCAINLFTIRLSRNVLAPEISAAWVVKQHFSHVLLDHAGCCLHLENDTESSSRHADILCYGLWNSCGIEPPQSQCSSAIQCRSFLMVSSMIANPRCLY